MGGCGYKLARYERTACRNYVVKIPRCGGRIWNGGRRRVIGSHGMAMPWCCTPSDTEDSEQLEIEVRAYRRRIRRRIRRRRYQRTCNCPGPRTLVAPPPPVKLPPTSPPSCLGTSPPSAANSWHSITTAPPDHALPRLHGTFQQHPPSRDTLARPIPIHNGFDDGLPTTRPCPLWGFTL